MFALEVLVKSAINLPNLEVSGKSDPYVIVEYQGLRQTTKVIEDELNPIWNETIVLDLKNKPITTSDILLVTVKDKDKITPDKFMGSTEVPLRNLLSGSDEMPLKVFLKNKKGVETTATIEMVIRYRSPKKAATELVHDRDKAGGDYGDDGGDGGDDDEVRQSDTGGGITMDLGGAGNATVTRSKAQRKIREPYSTKPQDFQVRVKVIEARQLYGTNIPPVCKVNCAGKNKDTKVKSQTNSPYWNEIFFFNFHESPAKLLDQPIIFGVYHSRKMRKDALIGSFKFDLALVYEQEKHSLINKWLLLSDPEDPMSGTKGYLKVSVIILGPRDEAPSLKVITDEEDDIETNLLRPAGLQLRPAAFRIRVYMAEDLPRMDPDTFKGLRNLMSGNEDKQFVDPYVEISFAGKKLKTSTKYATDHPEWNEEIVLNHQFPSMCEAVKFTVYDWDRVGNDDAIATTAVYLSHISAYRDDDEGFLPTFGPCFINLYGSPREFTDLPDQYEALNLGKGEGTAYRGRILVEIRTELLAEPIPDEVRQIDRDTVARIQKCFRRRKYRLHAAFLSACQIPGEQSSPIEFEVSVGNHGYRLDDSVPPCASTTPPTNPVYDGGAYSYLPWGDCKPCGVVDSQWEDVSYRVGAVNLLRKVADNVRVNLLKIGTAISAKVSPERLAQMAITAIDQFIEDCRQPLPVWEPVNNPLNDMDRRLKGLRDIQLRQLLDDAVQQRETLEKVEEAIELLEDYMGAINQLAVEPQLGFPDVIIWMLKGGKRKAYHRIPAYTIYHFDNPYWCGPYYGIPQTLYFKRPKLPHETSETHMHPSVQVRVILWLDLEKTQIKLNDCMPEATQKVVAETYENQALIMGKWVTNKPPLSRPAWSDSAGKTELRKQSFHPPVGWQWEGDWFVAPERSTLLKDDTGQTSFVEEMYYNEARTPTTSWVPATPTYTDARGDPAESPESIILEKGWEWDGEWEVDLKRLCDEEGFEYATTQTEESYMSTEKLNHMFRRKRLIRKRMLGEAGMAVKQTVFEGILAQKRDERLALLEGFSTESYENWEYAFSFVSKFHSTKRGTDMVRRRRWHRFMVPKKEGATDIVMQLRPVDDQKDETVKLFKKENLAAPRFYLQYETSHDWQLRAYIFQARNLLAGDPTGLSDPYVICSFQDRSHHTETLQGTLCPTWDQTLLFDHIELHGEVKLIATHPPPVSVVIYDWDKVGSDNFLGRCDIFPRVRLDQNYRSTLMWYDIKRDEKDAGQILAAFDLILLDGRPPLPLPPRRGELFRVPDVIRPKLGRKGIEILCWGVRNMSKYQLASVNSPSVNFEIGDSVANSKVIKNVKNNPNFPDPILFIDAMLPVDEAYMPPMNIFVHDHRAFGQKPRVGMHIVSTLGKFAVSPRTVENDPVIKLPVMSEMALPPVPTEISPDEKPPQVPLKKFLDMQSVDDDIDWWSKFYASVGEYRRCLKYRELGYDLLTVYNCCLEDVAEFGRFQDFCTTFTLVKGKNLDEDEDNFAGEFKGSFRIYDLPANVEDPLPMRYFDKRNFTSDVEECVVRVYVVRALDLQPNDPSGLADPYIEVKLGNKTASSKDNYIPNTLNPEFGRMFELKCRLPVEKDLRIRVKDFDVIGADDIIGETFIDLENRRLTKFRATCGIPQSYYVSGPNRWRDSRIPTSLLMERCEHFNLPPAQFEEPTESHPFPTCRFGARNYSLDQFERGLRLSPHHGPPKERLALYVLNQLQMVKEHVETRPLYNSLQPQIEQGRLQMWIDLYPMCDGQPGPAVDISARKPMEYVLRVVVWNTVNVVLQETSLLGEKMSDIYVKGWLAGVDERQKTDVHYRSLDGEGNFNWRLVFPFFYLPSENMIVIKRKERFYSLDETETRTRPNLIMQVWDNDLFNPDDFLGTLELNLSAMPAPAKNAKSCELSMIQSDGKNKTVLNLFECRRTKGFWPFMNETGNQQVLTGKIEMELEILKKSEEALRPAGRARDEPNANPFLPQPKRPATSFLWITSPWKTFKFIVWKRYKSVFIGILIAILVALLLFLFIYAIPQLLARKMVNV